MECPQDLYEDDEGSLCDGYLRVSLLLYAPVDHILCRLESMFQGTSLMKGLSARRPPLPPARIAFTAPHPCPSGFFKEVPLPADCKPVFVWLWILVDR